MQNTLDYLYKHYANPLYWYARTLAPCPNLAEDLLSETFLTVILKIEQLKNVDNPLNWLKAILHNQFLMHCRQNKNRSFQQFPFEEPAVEFDTSIDHLDDIDRTFATLDRFLTIGQMKYMQQLVACEGDNTLASQRFGISSHYGRVWRSQITKAIRSRLRVLIQLDDDLRISLHLGSQEPVFDNGYNSGFGTNSGHNVPVFLDVGFEGDGKWCWAWGNHIQYLTENERLAAGEFVLYEHVFPARELKYKEKPQREADWTYFKMILNRAATVTSSFDKRSAKEDCHSDWLSVFKTAFEYSICQAYLRNSPCDRIDNESLIHQLICENEIGRGVHSFADIEYVCHVCNGDVQSEVPLLSLWNGGHEMVRDTETGMVLVKWPPTVAGGSPII